MFRLKNGRTLHGEKLASLLDLLRYLPQGENEKFDKILLNITPVLGTLTVNLIPVDVKVRKMDEQKILSYKP